MRCSVSPMPRSPPRSAALTPRSASSCTGRGSTCRRAGRDIDQLMTVLAPDVILIADGGGKARAPLRPITGAAKVARLMTAVARRPYMGVDISDMTIEMAEINGGPGIVVTAGGKPIAVVAAIVADGRISAIHLVASPDKLRGLTTGRTLAL